MEMNDAVRSMEAFRQEEESALAKLEVCDPTQACRHLCWHMRYLATSTHRDDRSVSAVDVVEPNRLRRMHGRRSTSTLVLWNWPGRWTRSVERRPSCSKSWGFMAVSLP